MAKYLIIYSDDALQDLREIFEYIAGRLREPAIAAAQITGFASRFVALGNFLLAIKRSPGNPGTVSECGRCR